MTVKRHITYSVSGTDANGGAFSASFDAEEGLTVAQLKEQFGPMFAGLQLANMNFEDADYDAKLASLKAVLTNAKALPDWATMTAEEAANKIHNAIFSGQDKATANTQIDGAIGTVTGSNLTGALTSINTQLTGAKQVDKAIASDLIDLRTICEVQAKMIIYLRDLLFQQNQQIAAMQAQLK